MSTRDKTLRLVLGDQLTPRISSLEDADKDKDIILMAELWDEATYVRHHKKKIAFLFSAMRHYAKDMQDKGFAVDYIRLDDAGNTGSFRGEVERAIKRHKPDRIVVTFPGEYRVLEDMKDWEAAFDLSVEIRPDDRFLCRPEAFSEWAKGRKKLLMEYFYRDMRREHNILMDKNGEPEGGAWNFDQDNREPLPADENPPDPIMFRPDDITKEVIALVAERFADHFGDLEPFHFAVTREEAWRALNRFIEERLPRFGIYQDAMKEGEPFLYHSMLSFYLNAGLLCPDEAISKAEQAYYDGDVPINSAEGFIRQILGWREFVRGIYWHFMPDYAGYNALNAQRGLPDFYWSGETDMNCMRQCITDTKEHAYAHHIQRLMVTGNFALLAGIDPAKVNEWYLIVYADAYEWVEMPNVTGMILYADGGAFASKPYAAGGAYINRMSDYCKNCKYSVSTKTGDNACPFNYLYWDFLDRNRDRLKGNPRLGMIYSTWDKMSDAQREAYRQDARAFLDTLETYD